MTYVQSMFAKKKNDLMYIEHLADEDYRKSSNASLKCFWGCTNFCIVTVMVLYVALFGCPSLFDLFSTGQSSDAILADL